MVGLEAADGILEVTAEPAGDGWLLSWGERRLAAHRVAGGVSVDGVRHRLAVVKDLGRIIVIDDGVNHAFAVVDQLTPPRIALGSGGRVLAPIPGRVAGLLVGVGDAVVRGQVLVVLEAMKMELSLTASADGVVSLVCCAIGDMVDEGHELVELAEAEATG